MSSAAMLDQMHAWTCLSVPQPWLTLTVSTCPVCGASWASSGPSCSLCLLTATAKSLQISASSVTSKTYTSTSCIVCSMPNLIEFTFWFSDLITVAIVCSSGIQWSFINNSLQSQNSSRSAKGSSSLDRLYSRKIRKQLVHHKQVNVSHPNTNSFTNVFFK